MMAATTTYDPESYELINDLVGFIEVANVYRYTPEEARKAMTVHVAQIKMFFKDYYQDKEYEEPDRFGELVYFWERFVKRILSVEIVDKPKDMSEEDFLFDVKFPQYAKDAIREVMSYNEI